jgi:hypothetical protein
MLREKAVWYVYHTRKGFTPFYFTSFIIIYNCVLMQGKITSVCGENWHCAFQKPSVFIWYLKAI